MNLTNKCTYISESEQIQIGAFLQKKIEEGSYKNRFLLYQVSSYMIQNS